MMTFEQFDRQFPNDEACKDFIAAQRWPDGVRCPRCNRTEKVYALKARPYHWVCKNADCGKRTGYRFSVTTATIFQDTKISLRLWFKIGYLMLVSKKGMSSLQVRRTIFGENSGSDWRTTWYICHRWRAAMRGDAFSLTGTVEVDEAHIGGKEKNKHASKRLHAGRGPVGKTTVIGAISRKGNVVCQVIENADAATMTNFVRKAVSGNVDLVATDEHVGYAHLDAVGFPHETVVHSAGEYVRGKVHTNSIEGFWSLLKRGIVGTYHQVSKDYLPLYLNEFSYRHNNRKNPNAFADMITTCGR
jgi:transposase-like protein